MKRALFTFLFLASVAYSVTCSATEDLEYAFRQSTTTPVPDSARFVMVQASYAAKATLLLDRNTGNVWQLVEGKNGSIVWSKMVIEKHKWNIVADESKPNFTIFISRLGLKFTTLVNVSSGATWVLTDTKNGCAFSVIPME
jgi:hypothetical protein